MPFVTTHLEVFYCTHHSVDYTIPLGNGINPSKPLNGCEINVRSCFA